MKPRRAYIDDSRQKQYRDIECALRDGKFVVPRYSPENGGLPLHPNANEIGLIYCGDWVKNIRADGKTSWGYFKMSNNYDFYTLIEGTIPEQWLPQVMPELCAAIMYPTHIVLVKAHSFEPIIELDLTFPEYILESDYRLIRKINDELSKDELPYYVSQINWANPEYFNNDDNEIKIHQLSNGDAVVQVISAVYDPIRWQLVAALIAAIDQGLYKAILATLAKNNGNNSLTLILNDGENRIQLNGARKGFIKITRSMQDANANGISAAILHPLTGDPSAYKEEYFYLVPTSKNIQETINEFVKRLDLAVSYPIMSDWGEYLFTKGQNEGLVRKLQHCGTDWGQSYSVSKNEDDWKMLITKGIKDKRIKVGN